MTQSAKELFEELSSFIKESRKLTQEGAWVELAGLDKRVVALCKQIFSLSDAERAPYVEKFEILLAELTALGDELTQKRDAMQDEIQHVTDHKKAHKAYRRNPAAETKDKK